MSARRQFKMLLSDEERERLERACGNLPLSTWARDVLLRYADEVNAHGPIWRLPEVIGDDAARAIEEMLRERR